jgi:hypothetical protein
MKNGGHNRLSGAFTTTTRQYAALRTNSVSWMLLVSNSRSTDAGGEARGDFAILHHMSLSDVIFSPDM